MVERSGAPAERSRNLGGPWAERVERRLDEIRSAGRWRRYRDLDAHGPRGVLVEEDRKVVTFASNDYLGLSAHPAVAAAAHDAIDRWGTSAGGSRLITGARPIHADLEAELADWKGTERAVLFPTGFAANLGVLTALGSAGTRIVSDERNHASIIDGARLARADVDIWRHGDLDGLDELLAGDDRPTIVVADTVFSMDGDVLDVAAVASRCREAGALLVLDEAHAVLGPHPTEDDLAGVEVVRVGTLSKTLGSLGGFAACSGPVADLLVNVARSSIFTTALPPADAASALAALRILRGPEGEELIARLRHHVDRLRPGHPSPIVAVIVGDEDDAVAQAAHLLELGLHVPAIRPPTVAPGTSRLRITFCADHSDDEVDRLLAALARLGSDPNRAATEPAAPPSAQLGSDPNRAATEPAAPPSAHGWDPTPTVHPPR
ncbi:MAG: 8-amino-7-oxononanoate synthase [Actinobacteria bacterium]|nr:8-amino-7-oxononanoate synthase [Actinomycetota bacterium]